jgi:thermitase
MQEPPSGHPVRLRRPAQVLVVVATSLIAWAAAPALGGPVGTVAQDDSRARIVVGFQGLSETERQELLARLGAALRRHLPRLRAAGATVPAADRDAILARLRENENVKFAEVDRQVGLVRPRVGDRLRLGRAARTPDDEGFSVQYSLRQSDDHDVDATNAWETRTSCAKVAILDTGIDTGHKDLKENLWRNEAEKPNNGKDDDGNGYIDDVYGVDLVTGRGSGDDHNGHGTHVAGIIGARGDNDRGISGLCWKAKLISVRWMDADGRGYTGDAAEAIVYAVDRGARVINASYGSTTPTDVEREAIAYAAAHDALIVAAAGNDHKNDDKNPVYPAAYPDANVIAVAATDEKDRLADFSNYGKKTVDLAAPGDAIGSTWEDGDYRYLSGTSMAAPLVSASAAMLRKHKSASATRIRNLLLNHVDDKSKLKDKVASGGRLNIRRSLAAHD